MAQVVNLSVDQGATFSQNVTLYTGNSSGTFAANTTPYANGFAQMRRAFTSSTHTANIAVDIHPAGAGNNGVITLSMNSAVTAGIPSGKYVYDVELRGWASAGDDRSNQTWRGCEGTISCRAQATIGDWT